MMFWWRESYVHRKSRHESAEIHFVNADCVQAHNFSWGICRGTRVWATYCWWLWKINGSKSRSESSRCEEIGIEKKKPTWADLYTLELQSKTIPLLIVSRADKFHWRSPWQKKLFLRAFAKPIAIFAAKSWQANQPPSCVNAGSLCL